MLIAVILGNRLNDDGSMTPILKHRLDMAIEVDKIFCPDKIILSGGVANKKAVKSEARVMFDYLVEQGLPQDKLVIEDQSLTTKQNAQFSVPISNNLGATKILLCTSAEHMKRSFLNPIVLFEKQLKQYPNIKLCAYCQ